VILVDAAVARIETATDPAFAAAAGNSVMLSAIAAVLTVAGGLLLAYAQRVRRTLVIRVLARISSVGYAVPGTVLAVGILIPLAALDNAFDGFMRSAFGISTGLLISGSGAALVYAYTARFLTVSFGSIEAGLARVSPNLDMAARTLGRSTVQTLKNVHLPLIRPVLASAGMLVFIDCMKELPATILLRPFNFETLSTLVYGAASLEAFEDGAVAALAIVAIGTLPVIFLARTSTLSFRNQARESAASAAT
jgi:iron(III) transport system permease protein